MPDEHTDDRAATIVINGKTYEFPDSYTLGEARMLKKVCGIYLADASTLRIDDPDWIAFTVWCMLHREDPTVTVDQVEKLDLNPVIDQLFEILNAAGKEPAADPPAEAPGGETETAGPSSGNADSSETSSTVTSQETPPTTSGEAG